MTVRQITSKAARREWMERFRYWYCATLLVSDGYDRHLSCIAGFEALP